MVMLCESAFHIIRVSAQGLKRIHPTLVYLNVTSKLAQNHRVMSLTGIKSLLVIWAAIKSDSSLPQIPGMEKEAAMVRKVESAHRNLILGELLNILNVCGKGR